MIVVRVTTRDEGGNPIRTALYLAETIGKALDLHAPVPVAAEGYTWVVDNLGEATVADVAGGTR